MLRLALLVTVAACGSSPPPTAPAAPPPDCAGVVTAAARFVEEPGEVERVKSVVALRCVEDHWSTSATTCIAAAPNLEAAHGCIREHLTVAQTDRLMDGLNPKVSARPEPPKPAPALLEPALADEPPVVAPAGSQAAIAAKLDAEGTALYEKKAFAGASTKFRDAVARVPDARYFLGLCLSLMGEGKLSEALTACDAGRNHDPGPSTRQKLDAASSKIRDEAKAQGISLRR